MLSKIINFFKPPKFDSFEQSQKGKFLHITLLVIAIASFLLGIQNLGPDTQLDDYLFIFGGISLFLIPFIKRGYYLIISLLISILLLSLVTFSLMDGVGLKDAGMLGYPIFMIYTAYLFNKKAAVYTSLLSVGFVYLVFYLDQNGYLEPATYENEAQIKVIAVLLISLGLLLWVVMDNWERMMRNLKDAYDLTISGWSKTLEYRDQETEGHSKRVTKMTVELAKLFGFSGNDLQHIRRGALLHDIGKMAIPDVILLKKGSLTDEEWAVVKTHPTKGKNLLENIPYLKPALDIPYYHHERWDGSGYPEGLSKEEIPLAARIFAVIDVWDALRSDRPYRQAWTAEKSEEYIKEQSGILFDPKVVELFFEFLKNKSGDSAEIL